MAFSLFSLILLQMELAVALFVLNFAPLLFAVSKFFSLMRAFLIAIPLLPLRHLFVQLASRAQSILAEVKKVLARLSMVLICTVRSKTGWPLIVDRGAMSERRLVRLIFFDYGTDIEVFGAYKELGKAQLFLILAGLESILLVYFGISLSLISSDVIVELAPALLLIDYHSLSGTQVSEPVPDSTGTAPLDGPVPDNEEITGTVYSSGFYGKMRNASQKRQKVLLWLLKRKHIISNHAYLS